MSTIIDLLGKKFIIGMIHLAALPGSPSNKISIDKITTKAISDLQSLEEGGVDAVMVENLGDIPLGKTVNKMTLAAMTRVALDIRQQATVPTGINVLRNDYRSALAIARTIGAQFVRINLLSGAMITDQGIIEGNAVDYHNCLKLWFSETQNKRPFLLADVLVKHARPLGAPNLIQEAKDTYHRGRADAIILTGTGTGEPTSLMHLSEVKVAVPEAPLIVGSGMTKERISDLFSAADGAIIGTNFKEKGKLFNPVDPERVHEFISTRNRLYRNE